MSDGPPDQFDAAEPRRLAIRKVERQPFVFDEEPDAAPIAPEIAELVKRLKDAERERFDASNDAKNVRELYLQSAAQVLGLSEKLAQAERERDTALSDAKGCAKSALMVAGDLAKAEARASALEAALQKYGQHVPPCEADWILAGVEQKCSCGLVEARASTLSHSLHAEARAVRYARFKDYVSLHEPRCNPYDAGAP